MKNIVKRTSYVLLVAGVLTSCSPQVTSEMVTSGYDPVATNKVMIVESIDKVEKAQTIGQVTVDGKAVDGCVIPVSANGVHEVEVILG